MTIMDRAQWWTTGRASRVLRYGWALALAPPATVITYALASELHSPVLFASVAAVALAAAFGGTGPGLATGAAVVTWEVAVGGVWRSGPAQLNLALFAVVSAVVAHAIGWSRRAFSKVLAKRRVATERVRGRLAFLRAVTRAMDEGVYTIDRECRITYVNAAAERALGYRQVELLGRPFKEALRCERIDGACSGASCQLRNVMFTGEPHRAANDTLMRRDGTRFPVRYSSAPLSRGGEVVGAVVVFQDITHELRAAARERFLAEATEQLATSIDYEDTIARVARLALPRLGDWCMAVVLDDDGAPRRVAVEALHPERAEISRQMLEQYPIDLKADHGAGRVLRSGEPELLPQVADFVGRSGSTLRKRTELLERMGLRSFMAVPLQARGRTLGVLDFAVTDSDRQLGADDLALASALAQRCALAIDNARLHRSACDAILAREHMLAVVSHDLRNPLATIRLASEVVAKAPRDALSTEKVRSIGASMGRSCDRMNRLIGDLIDLASIDAGHLSITPGNWMAQDLAEDAVESVAAAAGDAGVAASYEVGAAPVRVRADRDRIHQVIVNLLTNAIHVTPPGGRVWVRYRERHGQVAFSVSDTGPGIDRDQRARIFDAYWRGSGTRYSGTGLGLSISRGIVEAHGGRLWVVSRPGAGATFRFTLPLASGAVDRPPRIQARA